MQTQSARRSFLVVAAIVAYFHSQGLSFVGHARHIRRSAAVRQAESAEAGANEAGANVAWVQEGMDPGGATLLMAAAIGNDSKEITRLAAGDKTGLNAQDDYGWTALRYAVRAGNLKAAKQLIEEGADVNVPSKSGRTPLMSAAGNKLSKEVSFLLQNGADANLKDGDGRTAYEIAMRGGATGCSECREMLKAAMTGLND